MTLVPVLLESPFAGNVPLNVAYARRCMRDCLTLGEAPFASHLLYTQDGILDDLVLTERELGIEAGLLWGRFAAKTVVYTDLGMSPGMLRGITRARMEGREVEQRKLYDWCATDDLQFPVEAKYAAKCAEINTLSIELALARSRHAKLSLMWGVLEPRERQQLFDAIFEGFAIAP